MTKELTNALNNVEITCANARLNREEHLVLARNMQLIRESCADKPKKKKVEKDGND